MECTVNGIIYIVVRRVPWQEVSQPVHHMVHIVPSGQPSIRFQTGLRAKDVLPLLPHGRQSPSGGRPTPTHPNITPATATTRFDSRRKPRLTSHYSFTSRLTPVTHPTTPPHPRPLLQSGQHVRCKAYPTPHAETPGKLPTHSHKSTGGSGSQERVPNRLV